MFASIGKYREVERHSDGYQCDLERKQYLEDQEEIVSMRHFRVLGSPERPIGVVAPVVKMGTPAPLLLSDR